MNWILEHSKKTSLLTLVLLFAHPVFAEDDGDRSDCLIPLENNPEISINNCDYALISFRCRSGSDLNTCIKGSSDRSGIVWRRHGRLLDLHVDEKGDPISERIVCRLYESRPALDSDGYAYCELKE